MKWLKSAEKSDVGIHPAVMLDFFLDIIRNYGEADC